MGVTYVWSPWLSGSYHPRSAAAAAVARSIEAARAGEAAAAEQPWREIPQVMDAQASYATEEYRLYGFRIWWPDCSAS